MRAAVYRSFGAARDVLAVATVPLPVPGPGEVRVRILASGVNPSDVKTRAGLSRPMSGAFQIPGSDGAGIVEAIGPDVKPSRLDERVWIFNAAFRRAHGTSAQFTVVPDLMAPPLPAPISFEHGACLGVPAMTAHRCVFSAGPVAGRTVLVTGGAGAVGHFAIQLAKWQGARVVATVSSEVKAAHARAAGADHVVNYREEDVVAAIRATVGDGVDIVVDVDFGANLATSTALINAGGTIASYASMGAPTPAYPFYALALRNATVRNVLVYSMPEAAKAAAVADLAAWMTTGRPRFAIARRFPLEAAAEAHEFVESGNKIGQVILDVS